MITHFTPYTPIACGLHDELQLRAMRRATVDLTASRQNGHRESLRGRVLDVLTRDGAEFLVVELLEDASRVELRLDHLISVDGLDFQAGHCAGR